MKGEEEGAGTDLSLEIGNLDNRLGSSEQLKSSDSGKLSVKTTKDV